MSESVASPTPPMRRPRRFWRWVKRGTLALALLITVAPLVGFGEMKWTRRSGQKKLDAATAKLDADDPGWRLEDIVAEHNSKVPPAESNSALKAVAIVGRLPKADDPEQSPWKLRERIDTARSQNERPDPRDWSALEKHYPAWEPGMIELRQWTAATPRGRFKFEYAGGSPLDIRIQNSHDVRTALSVLSWDSLHHAYGGRADRALASALSGLHLTRSVDFEPIFFAYLVRLRCVIQVMNSVAQTLAWCPNAADAALAPLQDSMLFESTSAPVRPSLRGERAYMHKSMVMADRGEISIYDDRSHGTRRERLQHQYHRQFLPNQAAFALERFDELSALLVLPDPEKTTAFQQWTLPLRNRENFLGVTLLRPVVSVVATAEIRHRARCLCTAAGIACERYRLKHGKWPAKLDDLTEFGMPQNLLDPFDGQPLRYSLLDDGAVVYSVDEDGRDDGGEVVRREGRPKDVGFRLWNPDRRKVPMPARP